MVVDIDVGVEHVEDKSSLITGHARQFRDDNIEISGVQTDADDLVAADIVDFFDIDRQAFSSGWKQAEIFRTNADLYLGAGRNSGVAVLQVDSVLVDQGAVAVYPDMVILDFAGSGDDFTVADSDVNIGISVMKGNTMLKDALNTVLGGMTADDFNALMAQAIAIQPIG